MCQKCKEWESQASALVWRGIQQRNKLRVLKGQVAPFIIGPLQGQFEALFTGVLDTVATLETQEAENQTLARNCPYPSLTHHAQSSQNLARRQEILHYGAITVGVLDETVAAARQFLALNMSGVSNPGDVLYKSGLSYLNMMSGVLDQWRAQSLLTSERWDSLWSDIKRRQDLLNTKKIHVMGGGTVIDLFPWD